LATITDTKDVAAVADSATGKADTAFGEDLDLDEA
jgi:hypothetical protein